MGRRLTQVGQWQLRSPEIVALHLEGKSTREISRVIGCSTHTPKRILNQLGYKTPIRTGEQHPLWKGGKIIDDKGYIRQSIPASHGFACMRSSKGWVHEHRLVMAEYLNRPLLDGETVHHVNGDRQDNRIENLQLRIGNHGSGQAYCCGDCGSRNLRPVEIGE